MRGIEWHRHSSERQRHHGNGGLHGRRSHNLPMWQTTSTRICRLSVSTPEAVTLSAVGGSPFGMPYQGVNSVAATKSVVVATTAAIIGNGTISVWTVTAATGGADRGPGSPYIISGGGASVTINPAGTVAYIPYNADEILAYDIDATTGSADTGHGKSIRDRFNGRTGRARDQPCWHVCICVQQQCHHLWLQH